MAVVHRARLHDGREVAVKVLRPGMAGAVALDLDLMQPIFRRLGLMGAEIGGLLYRYLLGFRRQVAEELDLRNEARTMHALPPLLEDAELGAAITVPEPIEVMTRRRVLMMEFLDGVAIDDLSAIEEFGLDPTPLVRALLDFWFLTGMRDGVFHGDIHAGNLMLLRDGRLGLIDWGIVGVLDERHAPHLPPLRRRHARRQRSLRRRRRVRARDDALRRPTTRSCSTKRATTSRRSSLGLLARSTWATRCATRRTPRQRRHRGGEGAPQTPAPLRAPGAKSGVADSEFGQANFLLFKQLLYFDRYGKLYLADDALMGNRAFLEKVLADVT